MKAKQTVVYPKISIIDSILTQVTLIVTNDEKTLASVTQSQIDRQLP